MAQPEKTPSAQASTIASCMATDCRHNEDESCTAGEIQVTMKDGQATCATFAPEKPAARP